VTLSGRNDTHHLLTVPPALNAVRYHVHVGPSVHFCDVFSSLVSSSLKRSYELCWAAMRSAASNDVPAVATTCDVLRSTRRAASLDVTYASFLDVSIFYYYYYYYYYYFGFDYAMCRSICRSADASSSSQPLELAVPDSFGTLLASRFDLRSRSPNRLVTPEFVNETGGNRAYVLAESEGGIPIYALSSVGPFD
jgi:hypothetical protein